MYHGRSPDANGIHLWLMTQDSRPFLAVPAPARRLHPQAISLFKGCGKLAPLLHERSFPDQGILSNCPRRTDVLLSHQRIQGMLLRIFPAQPYMTSLA